MKPLKNFPSAILLQTGNSDQQVDMITYRRLVLVTAFLLLIAAAAIPGKVLHCHWMAVSAFESQGWDLAADLKVEAPPFNKWVNQEWYSKLFGTVPSAHLIWGDCTAQEMLHLRNLRGLKELVLGGKWTDEAWCLLPRQLQVLELRVTLNDAVLQEISKHHQLEHLVIASDGGANGALPAALSKLQRLRSLLFYEPLSPSTLDALLTQHPTLENFHLEISSDDEFERISRHPNLKWLSLTLDPHDHARLKALEGLSTLKELWIIRVVPFELENPKMDSQIQANFALTRPDLKVSFHYPGRYAGAGVPPPRPDGMYDFR